LTENLSLFVIGISTSKSLVRGDLNPSEARRAGFFLGAAFFLTAAFFGAGFFPAAELLETLAGVREGDGACDLPFVGALARTTFLTVAFGLATELFAIMNFLTRMI